MEQRDQIVQIYFHLGLKQKEIVQALAVYHGIDISQRHLRRVLSSFNLRRREYTDINEAIEFIQVQLQSSGLLHGYRWMHAKCAEAGIKIQKEVVRLILGILDRPGVLFRQARRLQRRAYFAMGPNHVWHIDSYDKLAPFGIYINGCIDGYSRKIIWLNVYTTNSDPKVIGSYYIEAVERLGFCPRIIRTDAGTENGHIIQFQKFLRENGTDAFAGDKSALQGKSQLNQRIESWWGFLRKESIEFWLAVFHDFKDHGKYSGDFLDKNLMQFCFMDIIQVT